jgi:hypothetical protein
VLPGLLANANAVVSTDRIIDIVWGDEPPGAALSPLRKYMHRARASLGDRLPRPRPEAAGPGRRPVRESSVARVTMHKVGSDGGPHPTLVLSSGELGQLLGEPDARACGPAWEGSADGVPGLRQAERLVSWVRFGLADPDALWRLHALAHDLREAREPASVALASLEGAMSLCGTAFGNLQVRDAVTGSLRIAAQCRFTPDFLEYFAIVDDDTSACGRAAAEGSQTVIADVGADPGFAAHREIAAAAGFRAVQSTALVDPAGCLVGVLSTHFPGAHRPAARTLQMIRLYAGLVAEALAHPRWQEAAPTGADTIGSAAEIVFGGSRYGPVADAARIVERLLSVGRSLEVTAAAAADGAPRDHLVSAIEQVNGLVDDVQHAALRRSSRRGGGGPSLPVSALANPERLNAVRRELDLSVEEFWLRYLALGGTAMLYEFEAYLYGMLHLGQGEFDVAVHAINERATELGAPPRWRYS